VFGLGLLTIRSIPRKMGTSGAEDRSLHH